MPHARHRVVEVKEGCVVGPMIAELECRTCKELFQEVLEYNTIAKCPECGSYYVEATDYKVAWMLRGEGKA